MSLIIDDPVVRNMQTINAESPVRQKQIELYTKCKEIWGDKFHSITVLVQGKPEYILNFITQEGKLDTVTYPFSVV